MRKFNRNYNQRKALFKSLLQSLITWGKLTTTLPKAKVIKRLFDKLLSKAQGATLSNRRQIAADLSSIPHANRLVDVIAPLFTGRKSGFTTMEKVSIRRGDAVVMATLKLAKNLPEEKKEEKKEPKKEEVKKEVKVKKTKQTK